MDAGQVTVVIPAYNAAAYIRKAVDSVLAQSYADREIVVVDDGSTDATPTILAAYGEQIRVVRQPNGGLSSARNHGIRLANGAYIAFLDADDYWLPSKLERQIALLQDRPEVGFCSTATRVENPEGKELSQWNCPPLQAVSTLRTMFSRLSAIAGSASSVVVRRACQQQAGYFDESLRSLEDIDMWMRFAAIAEYACIDEPLTVILRRADSISRNLDAMRAGALQVLRKNRALLDARSQGSFWQAAYASVLCDYAKWEYRMGRRWQAIRHLLEALSRAPLQRGRMSAALLFAMLTRRAI
jgi:glycosyltransferase involved in cell wall biosynthesis